MAIVLDSEILTMLGGAASAADQAILTALRPRAERLVQKFLGYKIERQATITEYLPLRDQEDERERLVDGWEMVGNTARAYSDVPARDRMLVLGTVPVRSITSLYENDAAWDTAGGNWPASTLLTEGTDYAIDFDREISGVKLSFSGIVRRNSGAWLDTPRCIKVVYEGGLTADELASDFPEIADAVILTTIKKFNEIKSQQGYAKAGVAGAGGGGVGPVTSWGLQNFHESYDVSSLRSLLGMWTSLPREAMEMLEEHVNMRKYLG